MFINSKGYEVDLRYGDCFRPLTAFRLAEAFPECRDLAIAKRRQLIKHANHYRDIVADITSSSSYDNETKYLLIICVKTWMKQDPLIQELNLLDQYLTLTKNYEATPVAESESEGDRRSPESSSHVATQHINIYQISKAKLTPLESLFDPEHPRQTSGTISCCCPIHDERTPSFVIYRKSNRFKCFGCGEHGDAIQLYSKLHNCDFKTAVLMLT